MRGELLPDLRDGSPIRVHLEAERRQNIHLGGESGGPITLLADSQAPQWHGILRLHPLIEKVGEGTR